MMVTVVEATNVLAKSVKVGVFNCPKMIKITISYNEDINVTLMTFLTCDDKLRNRDLTLFFYKYSLY